MIAWVCERCGENHGRHPSRAEELVLTDCRMCGQRAMCASPSDFGGVCPPAPPALSINFSAFLLSSPSVPSPWIYLTTVCNTVYQDLHRINL